MRRSAPAGPEAGDRPTQPTRALRGIAISPGIAAGPVMVLDRRGQRLPPRLIEAAAVGAELERLDQALGAAAAGAARDEAELNARVGPQHAEILAAHRRMIEDPALRAAARRLVEFTYVAAEHAVLEVLDEHVARLEGLAESRLAARAADLRDIQARIVNQLTGAAGEPIARGLRAPAIVLAPDLTPSEAAGLDTTRVLAFATEAGGASSHTAIVAAALEIPAVAGLGPFLEQARRCEWAIVDGDLGLVVLDPEASTRARYERIAAERAERFQTLTSQADLPAETLDGCRVELLGNIEFGGEAAACLQRGAAGVGLFRTEFLFLNAEAPPSEDEQYAAYAAVVRSLGGRPITVRTLDLGADKLGGPLSAASAAVELNPSLGLRSLRLSLRDPRLFRAQLRALLRAAELGDVRVLFPLVTTLNELRAARAIVQSVADELRAEGRRVPEKVPIGVMVEVPAAALIADHLAKEVDFFSIGTNDLVQYALAVDRTNETVADLYRASDPAVLRLIAMAIEAARAHGIASTVCGTMGGDPLYTMLLLGLGARQLSMPSHQLPEIKRVVRAVRLADAEALAAEALRRGTAVEVAELLEAALRKALPERAAGMAPDEG